MWSIPGIPTQGSVASVLVTGVDLKGGSGLVGLWVSMDDGRRRLYQQMREDIQNPGRRFDGAEGRPGGFCLVCIGDVWHRARIVSIESGIYNVFLVDQGQPHATTGESLAWGKSDSFVLPPETESCVLANVVVTEGEPERAEAFLKSLPGKTFQAQVQDLLAPDSAVVLDVPTVSREMCEAGLAEAVPAEEFGNLARETRGRDASGRRQPGERARYLYPALLADTLEHVHVAEAVDPHHVFCTLLIFSGALRMLSAELQRHYGEGPDPGEAPPRARGDPCAAKGADGRWYRSVLRGDGDGGAVEVTHVDEGKTELVPADRVKPLHEKFLRMPVVTYRCRLDGAEASGSGWTESQTARLRSLILHQTVLATFSRRDTSADVYQVVLFANDAACLNSCFLGTASPGAGPKAGPVPPLFLRSSARVGPNAQEAPPHTKTPTTNGGIDSVASNGVEEGRVENGSGGPAHQNRHPAAFLSEETATLDGAPAVGSDIGVTVTHVEGPHKFWCQPTEKSGSLRRLMQNLQGHYASAHPPPIVESACVARDPDDGLWYRARVVAGPRSPVVDVRLVDYGRVRRVPLRDVRPIDPAFLRMSAQAFPCCLSGGRDLAALGRAGEAGLRCLVKAVRFDEEGLPLNVVDIEAPADGGGRRGAQEEEEEEAVQPGPGDAYRYSTHAMEVGGEETVCVTSCSNVNHFYVTLEKNAALLSRMNEIVHHLAARDERRAPAPGAGGACVAKRPDALWRRGRVVERHPQIRVHFVDHGDTLVLDEADVCAFPEGAAFAQAVPAQAVLLGLLDVPQDVPREVNRWFAARAAGRTFTAAVAAKAEGGKLVVDLFDGPANVNAAVREMAERASQSEQSRVPREERNRRSDGGGVGGPPDLEVIQDQALEAEHRRPADVSPGEAGSRLEPEEKRPPFQTCSEGSASTCAYVRPGVSPEQTLDVFASCVAGPLYFWCQHADTDELDAVSRLAQEVGQSQEGQGFLAPLDPGSPCLALFAEDERWYRAQVMRRRGDELRVVFIDYGNEADVEVKTVKPLPRALLERPPQAFLCSLDGFEEPRGTWDDAVYDVFYDLVVDEPLRVTVLKVQDNEETALAQYSVRIECKRTNVKDAVREYWTPDVKTPVCEEDPVTGHVLQRRQSVSTGRGSTHGDMSETKTEAFASCIVEPFFFWCQHADTEDLEEISRLCQAAGQSQLDPKFPPSLVPGSRCLALFSSDGRWHRAQVMGRQGDSLRVTFIDYGNEADVDVRDARALPRALLDAGPQAFLCSLGGFDGSRGSWDDGVYDDFHDLLANRPLRLTVLRTDTHVETGLPQSWVEVECEGQDVTEALKKHWRPLSKRNIPEQSPDKGSLTQDGQRDSSQTRPGDPEEETVAYKWPTFSQSQRESVYASSIVGPCFFWCQYADTETLAQISRLCQEAGQARPEGCEQAAVPGGPCLALFPGDGQWYRAQAMERRDAAVRVVYVDYGNEADVDAKHVRRLPRGLLGPAPQAFLCCLSGFEELEESCRDDVCEDFYRLLVDRPLRVTVSGTKARPDIEVPQHTVQVEFKDVLIGEWLDVSVLMERRARQKAQLASQHQLG